MHSCAYINHSIPHFAIGVDVVSGGDGIDVLIIAADAPVKGEGGWVTAKIEQSVEGAFQFGWCHGCGNGGCFRRWGVYSLRAR